jgi:hypothetical protein
VRDSVDIGVAEERCLVRWLIPILIASSVSMAQTSGALRKPDSASTAVKHQILPDFEADPSARVFHGRLYVYPSHDIAGSKDWDMIDWHVFSTDDMVHWKDHGVIDKHAWAPDCIERNGEYYFYFPADDQIGVAVSDSPTGPFKDPLGETTHRKDGSRSRRSFYRPKYFYRR